MASRGSQGQDFGRKPGSLRQSLERAYLEGIRQVARQFADTPEESIHSITLWIKQNPIVGDLIELESWIHTSRDTLKEKQKRARNLTPELDRVGAPYELTDLLRKSILRRERGRPIKPDLRDAALLVVEMKRDNPKLSWMRFTLSHCPCGEKKHSNECKESIRQAAMSLQRLMDRLGIAY